MSFCSECGTKLPDGASFCVNCGTPVVRENTAAPEEAERNASAGFAEEPAVDNAQPDYQQEFYRRKAEEEQRTAQQRAFEREQNQRAAVIRADVDVREIVTCVLLSLFTCGIYGIYWFYNIINDVNSLPDSENEQSAGLVILLSIVTCGIYLHYWMYKTGDKLDRIKQANGEGSSSYPILFLILSLLGLSLVNLCLIQNELNNLSIRSAQ